jgi:argininosuccinate synthase
MPRYAELIYNGFWFSPEREMLQAADRQSQANVTGTVRLKLYKGGVYVVGRKSPYSLYSEKVVTFDAGMTSAMRRGTPRLRPAATGALAAEASSTTERIVMHRE